MNQPLPEAIKGWLEGVREEHREILIRLHEILIGIEPGFTISLKWNNPAYSANDQLFFFLSDHANYVHLGLYNGAQTIDPHGLIEGTGKRLRHVKVSQLDSQIEQKLTDVIWASLANGSYYQG